MTVYIFDENKRVRKIASENSVTYLVHDEAAYTINATVSMDLGVKNGEHIGFMCVDGHFRIFTVTKTENYDDKRTIIIIAKDAIVQELMETYVEEKQQLDVQLIPAIEGLLDASDTKYAWTVTGVQPERLEKSRAYFADMWTMLEFYKILYEWQIVPYYVFYGGVVSARVIELKEDKAEFRGRILTSKKDASNVYVIRSNPPVTRLYVLGPSTGSGDIETNMTIKDVVWSTSEGDPVNKPKGQAWIEDPDAVADHGTHTGRVLITDAEDEEDLAKKGWEKLQKIKYPTRTVEATVQDLERVKGYENQVIRLGDLVPIRLSNASMEEARVVNVKRDYISHELTKVIIGDKEATIQSQVSGLIASAAHTFERLTIYKNRFHEDEALIQLNAEMIQMNAEVIEMNAKEIRANAEKIDLKAGQEEVADMGKRLSAAEILIDGIEAEIILKASRAELGDVERRLASAEILIDGANAEISLKANKSYVNELGERVTNAELLIDGQNSKIAAKADLILLDGYVKTTELEAEVLTVFEANIGSAIAEYLNAYELDVQSLVAASVNTEWLSADRIGTDSITTSELTLSGTTLSTASLMMGTLVNTSIISPGDINLSHSHAVTINGDGTITLGEVATTGGSFKIADTQYYKDGVSAAKKEGADSVTLTFTGWQNGVATVVASNGQAENVELPDFAVSGGMTFNSSHQTTVYFSTPSVAGPLASKVVDATSVYEAGYKAGYDAAKPVGVARSAIYDAAYNRYDLIAAVVLNDGNTRIFNVAAIDATAAYDAGYQAACDGIEIVNGEMSITNTAPNYMYASVRVTVEVDDVAIKSKTVTGSAHFPGLGQG